MNIVIFKYAKNNSPVLPRVRLLLLLLCVPVFQVQGRDKAGELRRELEHAGSDSAYARLCGLLAWELKFANLNEALQLAEKEIEYGKRQHDFMRLADGYRVKALTLVIAEKITEGMPLYDSALFCAQKAGSMYYQASCYSLMAGMYGDHADYDKAIELYAKGLEIAQRSGDPQMISTLSNNLAEAYQGNGGRTALVQKYLAIALENSIRLKKWDNAAMNSSNLALEYAENGDTTKARAELKKAEDFMTRDKADAYRYATNCHVLASAYLNLGSPEKAKRYASSSLRIMDSLKRPDNALRPLSVLTDIYIQSRNIILAEKYAARLLNEAKAQQAKLYIRDGYKAYAGIARLKNDFRAALYYFEQYKMWNDSIFQLAREQSIAKMEARSKMMRQELEVRYETQKKQQENQNLKKLSDNLRTEKIIILIACLVFAVLGALLYLANRKKQKFNAELIAEKKTVEKQAKEKGMLVHEIHHRVKNNLTMLKSMLYLQAKGTNTSEVKKALAEFEARIQSMALVHQSLYENDSEGKLDLVPFLENMAAELCASFCPPGKDIGFTVQGNCRQLDVSKAISLSLVMNELITNSLKYAFNEKNEGSVTITVSEEAGRLLIRYTDSGPGLKHEFDLQQGGFGFRLLYILIRQLNASLAYSKTGNTPEFRMEMPC